MVLKWVSDFSNHIRSAFTQWRGTASAWTWSLSSFDLPGAPPDFHQHIHVENQTYNLPQCSHANINRWHFSCLKYVPVAGFFHTSPSPPPPFWGSISYSLCSLRLPSSLKITAQSRCLQICHATCLASGQKIKGFFWFHFSPNNITVQHINVSSVTVPVMTGTYKGRVLSHKRHPKSTFKNKSSS